MSDHPKPATTKPTTQASTSKWGRGKLDSRPLYRVVEMVRDPDGRVRKQGNIWHTDLDVPRKFGRALASNTSSHRIVIEDNQGRVLEEVQVTNAGERKPVWTSWEDIPLPALSPTRQPPKRVPVLRPPPAEFDTDAQGEGNEKAGRDSPSAATAPGDQDCDVAL